MLDTEPIENHWGGWKFLDLQLQQDVAAQPKEVTWTILQKTAAFEDFRWKKILHDFEKPIDQLLKNHNFGQFVFILEEVKVSFYPVYHRWKKRQYDSESR